MTTYHFGASPDLVSVDATTGRPRTGVSATFYDAESGGSQDLTIVDSLAGVGGAVISGAFGRWEFTSDSAAELWLDTGTGVRWLVRARESYGPTGAAGATGPASTVAGPTGPAGPSGGPVPVGGTDGQVVAKSGGGVVWADGATDASMDAKVAAQAAVDMNTYVRPGRTNLCANPNFETDASGWVAYVGVAAPTCVTTTPFSGTGRLSAVGDNTAANPRVYIFVPGVAGDTITFTARVRSDGQTPTSAIVTIKAIPSGATIGNVSVAWAPDANGWQLVTATATLPAGDTSFQVLPGVQTAANYTGTLGVDQVLIEHGTVAGTYFDGSTAATPTSVHVWTGTPNLSISREIASTYEPLLDRYTGRNLYAYGHSYVAGGGASVSALRFTTLTAAALGMTEVNHGVSSEQTYQTANRAIHDDATRTFALPTDAGAVVICSTLNGVRRWGSVAADVLWEANAMNAMVELFCAATRTEQTAFTFTGVWAGRADSSDAANPMTGARYSNGTARYTITDTDYFEVPFDGDTVTVHSFAQPVGSTLTVEYKVDGVVVKTKVYSNHSDATGTFPRIAERLDNLGPGLHTLRVTKTAGAQALWADFITTPALLPPPIVIVPATYLTAAGYATGSPFINGSNAAFDTANRQLAGIARRFPNVAIANVAWDKNTMIAADLIHPNDLGHATIRDAVVVAARRLAYAH